MSSLTFQNITNATDFNTINGTLSGLSPNTTYKLRSTITNLSTNESVIIDSQTTFITLDVSGSTATYSISHIQSLDHGSLIFQVSKSTGSTINGDKFEMIIEGNTYTRTLSADDDTNAFYIEIPYAGMTEGQTYSLTIELNDTVVQTENYTQQFDSVTPQFDQDTLKYTNASFSFDTYSQTDQNKTYQLDLVLKDNPYTQIIDTLNVPTNSIGTIYNFTNLSPETSYNIDVKVTDLYLQNLSTITKFSEHTAFEITTLPVPNADYTIVYTLESQDELIKVLFTNLVSLFDGDVFKIVLKDGVDPLIISEAEITLTQNDIDNGNFNMNVSRDLIASNTNTGNKLFYFVNDEFYNIFKQNVTWDYIPIAIQTQNETIDLNTYSFDISGFTDPGVNALFDISVSLFDKATYDANPDGTPLTIIQFADIPSSGSVQNSFTGLSENTEYYMQLVALDKTFFNTYAENKTQAILLHPFTTNASLTVDPYVLSTTNITATTLDISLDNFVSQYTDQHTIIIEAIEIPVPYLYWEFTDDTLDVNDQNQWNSSGGGEFNYNGRLGFRCGRESRVEMINDNLETIKQELSRNTMTYMVFMQANRPDNELLTFTTPGSESVPTDGFWMIFNDGRISIRFHNAANEVINDINEHDISSHSIVFDTVDEDIQLAVIHYAIVLSPTDVKLYINGELSITNPHVNGISNNILAFNDTSKLRYNSSGYGTYGSQAASTVRDMRFYTKELSASDVLDVYNAQS